jgi:hypothetical protein
MGNRVCGQNVQIAVRIHVRGDRVPCIAHRGRYDLLGSEIGGAVEILVPGDLLIEGRRENVGIAVTVEVGRHDAARRVGGVRNVLIRELHDRFHVVRNPVSIAVLAAG